MTQGRDGIWAPPHRWGPNPVPPLCLCAVNRPQLATMTACFLAAGIGRAAMPRAGGVSGRSNHQPGCKRQNHRLLDQRPGLREMRGIRLWLGWIVLHEFLWMNSHTYAYGALRSIGLAYPGWRSSFHSLPGCSGRFRCRFRGHELGVRGKEDAVAPQLLGTVQCHVSGVKPFMGLAM